MPKIREVIPFGTSSNNAPRREAADGDERDKALRELSAFMTELLAMLRDALSDKSTGVAPKAKGTKGTNGDPRFNSQESYGVESFGPAPPIRWLE